MARRLTRRQARSWLAPIRRCFAQMKSGEVDSIQGFAVTRLHDRDDYARIDYCIAGFRALIDRLCPEIDASSLARMEKRLANGVPVTLAEVDACLAVLRQCESALLRHSVSDVKSAVLTEQVAIELQQIGVLK